MRPRRESGQDGRLRVHLADIEPIAQPGVRPLPHTDGHGGVLAIPARGDQGAPLPVLLMLHGAGGTGNHAMHLIADVADTHGVAVVAPDSEGQTWDLLGGGFGGDAAYIAEVLSAVGREAPIDPAHLAIGGFSDGASYALSLGLTNGDLFTHVIAFSPGFMAPGDRTGTPQVYLSHGTHDTVLPIDRCSRRIVPALRGQGYEVTYREFEGPHTVPETISHEAMTWLLAE